MSALAAQFIRTGDSASRDVSERMRNAQRIYGPDKEAVRIAGPFGLSWTHRIGFTPQDRNEQQPMAIGSRWLMLFCGRLDHRDDLARELEIAVEQRATISDGEMVRRAWERWRDQAPAHIYGQYSYIVCDLDEHRVEAVRGPLRSPPLHWFATPDRLLIASMPKGLFAVPDVPRTLNEQKIADFLALNQEELEASFFLDIRSLPLGHRLIADRDNVRVSRFYALENIPQLRFKRNQDYVDAAKELLDRAVASAMRSVETPAISLSSGLDSTAVAVTALDHLAAQNLANAKPLLGLTAVPDPSWDGLGVPQGSAGDESGAVRALMARYPQMPVEFIDSAGASIDEGLDQLHFAADRPMRGIGNLHWGLALARRIRSDGRRVELTGASGNATLSLSVFDLIFSHWLKHGRLLHALREWGSFTSNLGLSGVRRWRGLPRHSLKGIVPQSILYPSRKSLELWSQSNAIHPDFAKARRVDARMAEMGWADGFEDFGSHRGMMKRMLDRGNRHESGAAIMAHEAITGVEQRDPLGDQKIVEFCYAIPVDQYFGEGKDRWLMRRVMADRLPAEILHAPRGDQSADWLTRLKRDAVRFDSELEQIGSDPAMASRLEIARLRQALANLPLNTPTSQADFADFKLARYGIGRALSVARFVHSIQGRNQ